jgi:hypothetical protein
MSDDARIARELDRTTDRWQDWRARAFTDFGTRA